MSSHDFFSKGQSNYGAYRSTMAAYGPIYDDSHSSVPFLSLKGQTNQPSGPKMSSLDTFKEDISNAKTAREKVALLTEAADDPKNTPQIAKFMALAFEDPNTRAEVMTGIAKAKPQLNKVMASMDPKLTSLENRHDVESVGQDIALLSLPNTRVNGATFGNNVDLSRNNLNGARLNVVAPGLRTAGAFGSFDLQGAHLEQQEVDVNSVSQAKLGAVTGFGNMKLESSSTSANTMNKAAKLPTPFSMDPSPFAV